MIIFGHFGKKSVRRSIFTDHKNEDFTLIFVGFLSLRFYGGVGGSWTLEVVPPDIS